MELWASVLWLGGLLEQKHLGNGRLFSEPDFSIRGHRCGIVPSVVLGGKDSLG